MRCKCCVDRLVRGKWPYHSIEPYITALAKSDKIAMAEEKPRDVQFSFMTVSNIKGYNNLSESEGKNNAVDKFTSDQKVLQNPEWFNGDIGPIGLEMDEPSRPSSPCSLPNNENCRSSQCDKLKCATDRSVNSKSNHSEIELQNCNCEIPSIFLHNDNSISIETTLNPNLSTNNIETSPSTLKEENISTTTEDYLSDDCSSSSYYVPSTMSVALSDCEVLKSAAPPIRPPRMARIRREKTQSEADANLSLSAAVSYKSLRSQSDPSAHFTTVVKPRALRPSCGTINIGPNNVEVESSVEVSSGRQNVLQEVQPEHSSAFKERSENGTTEARDRPLLCSKSLEISSPSSDDPVFSRNGSVIVNSQFGENLSHNASRSWAKSMNDVLASRMTSSPRDPTDEGNVAFHRIANSSQSTSKLCEDKPITSQPNGHARCIKSWGDSEELNSEPIHMTLEEVKANSSSRFSDEGKDLEQSSPEDELKKSPCRQFFRVYFRPRKSKKCATSKGKENGGNGDVHYHRHSFPINVKVAISSLFGLKRNSPKKKHYANNKMEASASSEPSSSEAAETLRKEPSASEAFEGDDAEKPSPNTSPFTNRALPPLPVDENGLLQEPTICVRDDDDSSSLSALSTLSDNYISTHSRTRSVDYAASIEKVKDCGWYWGPISGETAEKLLSNEPDGAFVVRDSSDEHYIFSLTFKLNGWVRHVRIEHDHGNFSFGCQQKFRSNTIVDFIENAVEHSRSGRYLFFLHRRPVLGPMRVQLLHPVSRFKQVQSLQHMCRFVILKSVRRDLIDSLPLPRSLRDYLNTPHYYSEELSHLSTMATAALTASANSAAPSVVSSLSNVGTEPS